MRRYINELTLETNRMLGENNFRLAWKGPYERHDSQTHSAPSNPSHDVLSVKDYGCDAVVFMVFNKVRIFKVFVKLCLVYLKWTK